MAQKVVISRSQEIDVPWYTSKDDRNPVAVTYSERPSSQEICESTVLHQGQRSLSGSWTTLIHDDEVKIMAEEQQDHQLYFSHFHASVVVMICVIPLELVVILVKVQYRANDLLPLRCAGGARCSARVTHLVFPDFA